jgi:hypothetical protein
MFGISLDAEHYASLGCRGKERGGLTLVWKLLQANQRVAMRALEENPHCLDTVNQFHCGG